ncbi:hypothetical protein B0I35DRAFT_60549 [Stachybotrys elegans]|uniref:Uncharacterized protein n=1 Tax=Stachybotrys elegans TaxID=80388 RepID=A0A8K0SMQ4_9HYPO|nr:hypothetical protein B0I35DRAFT_60549 [Stachybotrys elegans]
MDQSCQTIKAVPSWLWLAGVAGISIPFLWTEFRKRQATRSLGHKQHDFTKKPQQQTVAIEPLCSFDWTKQDPLRPRPFKPTYNITMGLQADTISNLIVIDKTYRQNIELRREIIATHGKTVHGLVPEGADSIRELYEFLMVDYLPVRYPTLFQLSPDKMVMHNLATGKSFPTRAVEDLDQSLRIIAETVEDDFFLLHETPEGHRSVAFVVCFASGFDPSEKLGQGLKDIHGPVPSYDKIGPSMERFFSRLEVGRVVKRGNWAIQTHPNMFAGEGKHPTESDAKYDDMAIDIEQTYYRTELQALSRLPKTRAILFSFKTYLTPMTDIKAEGSGEQLADAIEGLKNGNAPGMWVYKGGSRWARKVCDYLRS